MYVYSEVNCNEFSEVGKYAYTGVRLHSPSSVCFLRNKSHCDLWDSLPSKCAAMQPKPILIIIQHGRAAKAGKVKSNVELAMHQCNTNLVEAEASCMAVTPATPLMKSAAIILHLYQS